MINQIKFKWWTQNIFNICNIFYRIIFVLPISIVVGKMNFSLVVYVDLKRLGGYKSITMVMEYFKCMGIFNKS